MPHVFTRPRILQTFVPLRVHATRTREIVIAIPIASRASRASRQVGMISAVLRLRSTRAGFALKTAPVVSMKANATATRHARLAYCACRMTIAAKSVAKPVHQAPAVPMARCAAPILSTENVLVSALKPPVAIVPKQRALVHTVFASLRVPIPVEICFMQMIHYA